MNLQPHVGMILLTACLLLASGPAAASSEVSAGSSRQQAAETLHSLFDEEWQRELAQNPIKASSYGERKYDALMPDLSAHAIEANRKATRAALRIGSTIGCSSGS